MRSKIYYQKNREKILNYANNYKRIHNEYSPRCKIIITPQRLWAQATLWGHKYAGYQVKITVKELVKIAQNTSHCYFCNIKLDWDNSKLGENYKIWSRPSLDRINNESLLTVDNVQILCRKCNTMKSNNTNEQLLEWCKKVVITLNRGKEKAREEKITESPSLGLISPSPPNNSYPEATG